MISELTGLDQIVGFTFLLTFFGMSAGSIFFFFERERVTAEYRQAVVMSALTCGVAAMSYFFMQDLFISSAASDGEQLFPTEFRYIDWFLTVPIMVLKFPSLLGLGGRGRRVMAQVVGLATLMILGGFIGELNPDNMLLHLGFYGIGMVAWFGLFGILGPAIKSLPDHIDDNKRQTIKAMGALVLIGWVIYPIGYLQPTLGFDPVVRELIYNVGDLANKVGLGLLAYFGGRRAFKALQDDETVEPAVNPELASYAMAAVQQAPTRQAAAPQAPVAHQAPMAQPAQAPVASTAPLAAASSWNTPAQMGGYQQGSALPRRSRLEAFQNHFEDDESHADYV